MHISRQNTRDPSPTRPMNPLHPVWSLPPFPSKVCPPPAPFYPSSDWSHWQPWFPLLSPVSVPPPQCPPSPTAPQSCPPAPSWARTHPAPPDPRAFLLSLRQRPTRSWMGGTAIPALPISTTMPLLVPTTIHISSSSSLGRASPLSLPFTNLSTTTNWNSKE